jgi:hypothetical protein
MLNPTYFLLENRALTLVGERLFVSAISDLPLGVYTVKATEKFAY